MLLRASFSGLLDTYGIEEPAEKKPEALCFETLCDSFVITAPCAVMIL